jgi:hypothetical protein
MKASNPRHWGMDVRLTVAYWRDQLRLNLPQTSPHIIETMAELSVCEEEDRRRNTVVLRTERLRPGRHLINEAM